MKVHILAILLILLGGMMTMWLLFKVFDTAEKALGLVVEPIASAYVVSSTTNAAALSADLALAESTGQEVYIVLTADTSRNIRGIVGRYWHLGDSIQLDHSDTATADIELKAMINSKEGVSGRTVYISSP